MTLRETDTGPHIRWQYSQCGRGVWCRYGRPALRQASFDWKAANKYKELLSFEMEVMNIPQSRTYKLNDGENIPIIKMGQKGGTACNGNNGNNMGIMLKMIQFLNGMSYAYIFSLLPHILVLSNKSPDHVSVHLM